MSSIKRILITGCSSGIGRAAAIYFAEQGHDVIATARNVAGLNDLAVAQRLALDVTDVESVNRAVEVAGAVDVLINNAGCSVWSPAELCPWEQTQRVIDTNFLGTVRMVEAVLPQMRERRSGHIVQISSVAARYPRPLLSIYSASKAALEAYSWSLRLETRQFGVCCTVVSMGSVESAVDQKRFIMETDGTPYEDLARRTQQANARGRNVPAPASDVAELIDRVIKDPDPPYLAFVGEETSRTMETIRMLSDRELEQNILRDI